MVLHSLTAASIFTSMVFITTLMIRTRPAAGPPSMLHASPILFPPPSGNPLPLSPGCRVAHPKPVIAFYAEHTARHISRCLASEGLGSLAEEGGETSARLQAPHQGNGISSGALRHVSFHIHRA